MQINELLDLTFWVTNNIKNRKVVEKYQQLLDVMQQNVNLRNNQPRQPFESQKDSVIEVIGSISMDALSNEQERMLATLSISPYIGTDGIDHLESLLFKNSLDIATAVEGINKIVLNLSGAIKRTDQIQNNLKVLVESEADEEAMPERNDVIMSVRFQNEVALDNLTDFKKWGAVWWEIGRGIAMAHDQAPENIRIVGAQKGSIIISLAVVAGIATTTSTIILSALKVADRVLTIRKKAEEIKALKLSNQKLELELEKEAEKEKKEGLETISDEIVVKLKLNRNGDGEKVKVLEKSIKNLIDFVEKGGEVDFYADSENEEAEDIEKIRVNFAEIKKLEKRLLAIESKGS